MKAPSAGPRRNFQPHGPSQLHRQPQRHPRRTSPLQVGALLLLGLLLAPIAALAQEPPPGPSGLADGVGIRVSISDLRPHDLEADLDLTMYTRVGPYSSTNAGVPTYGFPALDYGDGDTLATTLLVLEGTGTGPGGSNVYRSAASFTHTYPASGSYTVTAASLCTACVRAEYTFLYPGGTPTASGPGTIDYRPQTVVGNLAGTYTYSGTTETPFGSYLVRYAATYYLAVTNTARVELFPLLEIPTTSTWGLLLLGASLLVAGWFALRRL